MSKPEPKLPGGATVHTSEEFKALKEKREKETKYRFQPVGGAAVLTTEQFRTLKDDS